MANEGIRVSRYLEELSGAFIGATAIWFFAIPLYFEFARPEDAIPGWFWAGLVIGIVVSTIITMVARRVVTEAHRRA